MVALLAFVLTPLGRALAIGLAVLTLAGGFLIKYRSDILAAERAKQQQESLNNLRNRTETNEQVNKLPAPDLDSELNRWVRPDDR